MGGGGGGGGAQHFRLCFISCFHIPLGVSGPVGACPPENFWYFCALRQLLVQSEAKICLTVVS